MTHSLKVLCWAGKSTSPGDQNWPKMETKQPEQKGGVNLKTMNLNMTNR